jgi:hypothetical protein
MKLLYRHCKALGYCDQGLVEFARLKGIDYDDFVANGIPVELAKSWKDVMVDRALALAESEAQNG